MANVVQNMINNVLGDAARKTKFEAIINFGEFSKIFPKNEDVAYLIKTSEFPGRTNSVMDFKYKGQSVPLKGLNEYDHTWSCTFYLTETHQLKKAFEEWMEALEQVHNKYTPSKNVQWAQNVFKNGNYTTQADIIQLDFDGTQKTAVYQLFNVFPKSVSKVDVDYSSVGTMSEFTVEFSYSYYTLNYTPIPVGLIDGIKAGLRDAVSQVVGAVKGQITKTATSYLQSSGIGSALAKFTGMGSSAQNYLGSLGKSGADYINGMRDAN